MRAIRWCLVLVPGLVLPALTAWTGCYQSAPMLADADPPGRPDAHDDGPTPDAHDGLPDLPSDDASEDGAEEHGTDACRPSVERCNGLDDDCDGLVDEDVECPCPMMTFRDHTYLFCEDATWYDARSFCLGYGFDLASMNDAEENSWVGAELAAHFDPFDPQAWIGFTDEAEEGRWAWANGDPVTFTSWAPGEPNDAGNEDCVVNEYNGMPGLWNDWSCTMEWPFVCESGGATTGCGDGACNLGETCSGCPADCGICASCGDGACNPGETCSGCPADCGACASGCEPPAWDVSADFSPTDNPNGAWTYGWTESDGTGFALSTPYVRGGIDWWGGRRADDGNPSVCHNATAAAVPVASFVIQPGATAFHPGPGDERAVVRWSAPTDGAYLLHARFFSMDYGATDVSVLADGLPVHEAPLDFDDSESTYDGAHELTRGGVLDATVGFGSDFGFGWDTTGIEMSVQRTEWILSREFSGECNPTGAWSFGSTTTLGGFEPLANHGPNEYGCPIWWAGASFHDTANVWKNTTASDVLFGVEPGWVSFHPGCDPAGVGPCGSYWSVVRWTSPFAGQAIVHFTFGAGDSGMMRETVALVDDAGGVTILWEQPAASGDESSALRFEVQVGSHIDFVLGQDGWGYGNTPLDVRIRNILPMP